MTKVKFYITTNGVKTLQAEREMSQREQDSLIHYLDDHYKKMRVDDLKWKFQDALQTNHSIVFVTGVR